MFQVVWLVSGRNRRFIGTNGLLRDQAKGLGEIHCPIVDSGKSIVLLSSLQVSAELDMQQVHPDEPVEYTFSRFSFENALEGIGTIRCALDGFSALTRICRHYLSDEEISIICYTDWESQSLGFFNWCGSVEGALYYSNYRIRKLEYEIALLRAESGEIDISNLESAEAEFRLAESLFIDFWESFSIAD